MKIRPLTPDQAKRSLAQRLTRVADNSRQIAVRLGVRSYRVYLTWTKWTGSETGEGHETIFKRVELLPTPLVKSLDNVSFSPFSAGVVPEGSLRLTGVSASRYNDEDLRGVSAFGTALEVPEPYDFFYEVVEDGRGAKEPQRQRYQLLTQPMRDAESAQWTLMLERASQDRTRRDKSPTGKGETG